jgi:hypothetical protein
VRANLGFGGESKEVCVITANLRPGAAITEAGRNIPAYAGIPDRRFSMRTTSAGARAQNSAQSFMSTRRFASS